MGWINLLGIAGLVGLVLLAKLHAQGGLSEQALLVMFTAAFTLVAIGVIAMIVDLNVTSGLTADTKRSWRTLLAFTGPLAPCFYFLRKRRPLRPGMLTEMGKETWNRPFGRRPKVDSTPPRAGREPAGPRSEL